jgi:integrase
MRRKNKYGLEQDERGIWHCDFSAAAKRFQRSCFTAVRAQAEEHCAALASGAWREAKLGERPAVKWEDASAAWFKDKEADGKRDLANDEDKKLVLAPHLDGHSLHQFHSNPEERKGVNIDAALDTLQQERGWSNATRNRHRSHVIGILNHARDKGYNVPHFKIARRKEIREEPRHLTREEAPAFIADLYENAIHIGRPARFSLACGARQSNVTGLRWFRARYAKNGAQLPHVAEDLAHMIVPAAYSKSGKTLRIPLHAEAIAVLHEARDCQTHGTKTHVFTFHGEPIEQPYNTSFIAAVKRQGLDGFNWHGLRHTWTTWHLEDGTPVEVVMKLGGWSSIHVLLKHYAHLINQHVAKYANNVRIPAMLPAAPAAELKVA